LAKLLEHGISPEEYNVSTSVQSKGWLSSQSSDASNDSNVKNSPASCSHEKCCTSKAMPAMRKTMQSQKQCAEEAKPTVYTTLLKCGYSCRRFRMRFRMQTDTTE
jgi:hypothetical protein